MPENTESKIKVLLPLELCEFIALTYEKMLEMCDERREDVFQKRDRKLLREFKTAIEVAKKT